MNPWIVQHRRVMTLAAERGALTLAVKADSRAAILLAIYASHGGRLTRGRWRRVAGILKHAERLWHLDQLDAGLARRMEGNGGC